MSIIVIRLIGNVVCCIKDPGGNIYKLNNRGPKIDPWGTPYGRLFSLDLKLPIATEKERLVRYEENHGVLMIVCADFKIIYNFDQGSFGTMVYSKTRLVHVKQIVIGEILM